MQRNTAYLMGARKKREKQKVWDEVYHERACFSDRFPLPVVPTFFSFYHLPAAAQAIKIINRLICWWVQRLQDPIPKQSWALPTSVSAVLQWENRAFSTAAVRVYFRSKPGHLIKTRNGGQRHKERQQSPKPRWRKRAKGRDLFNSCYPPSANGPYYSSRVLHSAVS